MDWREKEVTLSCKQLGSLLKRNHLFLSGKTLRERSPQTLAQISGQYCKRLPTLGSIDWNGNCLIQGGFYPKIESAFTLSDILQEEVPERYFLSQKMTDYLEGRSQQKNDNHKPKIHKQST
jgi:hypothetical protein